MIPPSLKIRNRKVGIDGILIRTLDSFVNDVHRCIQIDKDIVTIPVAVSKCLTVSVSFGECVMTIHYHITGLDAVYIPYELLAEIILFFPG